jgi:hypothetical protein
MDSVKRYPVLTAVLALCVAAFAVESFFLYRFNTQVTVAQRNLKTAQSTAQTLEQASPAPTDDNKATALKNVDDLQATLDKVTKTLSDTPQKITDIPTSGADLLIDIQGYVTDLQGKAKDRDIMLPADPNFAFGMSMYVGKVSAPPPEKVAAVYTQMKVLDYILGHLMGDAKLDDQKMKITSVMRENVAAMASSPGAPVVATDSSITDIFVIPPTITARGPGVDTLAFQIEFVGYTESLRLLLGDLKNFEMPLVVRSIQVEHAEESEFDSAANATASSPDAGLPRNATAAERASARADAVARRPVVADNLSRFTLVIEYVQLPQPPPTPATTPDGAAAPAGTAAPAASATTSN